MVDKVALQTKVQMVYVILKTVNQDIVKELGFMLYFERLYGRGSLVNFKINDSILGRKRFIVRS